MGIPVLVVDSDVENAKRIKHSLEENDLFQVTLATRAIEALMRFTETRFQVAIIDFGLPDLNGADIIRQFRGIDESVTIVAVLDNRQSKPSELEQLAVNLVLKKSANISNLPQKLSQILNLPSELPSPPKESVSPPQTDSPAIPDKVAQEGTQREDVQQTVSQEPPLQENVSQAEAFKEGQVPQEMPPPEAREEVAAQEGAAPAGETLVEAALEEPTQKEAPQALDERREPTQEKSVPAEPPHEFRPMEEDLQEQTTSDEIPSTGGPEDRAIGIPPWLKESAQVEEYLATLEKEHTAYATLLSLGNTPWTYSEQLSEGQAHGIVRLLSEHDEGLQDKGALIRYIRLSSSGNDYLLYATPVVGNINLTLIFSMDTPFSVARRQTHKLSRLLVTQDPRKLQPPEAKPTIDELAAVSQDDDEPLLPSDWIPAPAQPVQQAQPSMQSTSTKVEMVGEEKQGVEPAITATSEILPIPNDWLPKEPKPTSHLPFLDQEVSEPKQPKDMEPVNLTHQEPKYYLPFTAILLPRFPNHRLTGSLSNQIETWLGDLCIAWGWRVETIHLRPEYLRFTFDISPDIAPAQAVQNLAQNLSHRILEAFPGFTQDLPSGQFWTKSYLLTAGSDVGKDRLAYFIETTRKDQGLIS